MEYIPWSVAERARLNEIGRIKLSEELNLPVMNRINSFKKLEGELLTMVESFGMNEKQEDAGKSITRRILWDFIKSSSVIPNENDEQMSGYGHAGVL